MGILMKEEDIIYYIQNKSKNAIPLLNFISYIFYPHISIPLMNILIYYNKINLLNFNLFIIYMELIISSIKISVGRLRPYKKHKNYIKGFDVKKPKSKSFPSSHSAYSMMTALIIYNFIYPNKLIFIFPLLMGLSRMALGVHYLSDVLVGYLIAFLLF